MERKFKISIPKPCHEDWDKMTPKDNGRFCMSCSKNVVDFTTMLPDEIQVYFQQNSNICGRFKNSQLNSLTIQIPSRILSEQTQYHKMFLLALFIAMGTTLFSCADKNGNKQKIDKVEVVEDSTEINNITVGVLLPPKLTDSAHQVMPSPPKSDQVKFVKPKKIKCGDIVSSNNKIKTDSVFVYDDDSIFMGIAGINVCPDFKGGADKFYSFIKENFKISKKNKTSGELHASFYIEKDGSLNDIKIIKQSEITLDDELTRVLKSSPKWYPAEEQGKKVRFNYEIVVLITNDTIRKNFLSKKIISKIDAIELKKITKFKQD